MKHTPGPWITDGYPGKPPLLVANRTDVICMFLDHERIKKKDIEANARLIAAAPDLLASGKARIEALEALLACYRLGKRATEKLLTQLEQSKKGWEAAIKKAEEED